jgi:hypothetical protein
MKKESTSILTVTAWIAVGILIGLVCGVVWIFYVQDIETLADTSNLANTLSPFIAIGVGFLTYRAFYIQYQANQDTKEQFRIQHQNSLEAGFETSFFAR